MIEDRIQRFLIEELHAPPSNLTRDYALIERGVLDSMGLFQLVSFIESSYHIKVEDEELSPENFRTIEAIAAFVESKGSSEGIA
jgi:acyl carrier protein